MTRTEYLSHGALESAVRGSNLPHAKLNETKVMAIRANVNGWPRRLWAEYYEVHIRTIDKVCEYRSWTHVR